MNNLTALLASNQTYTLLGSAILALTVLILFLRKLRHVKAGKIADALSGPVMFGGMIWSAEAAWELTGPEYLNLPTPLRISMFAVVEFTLLVAMLRAKDSMDRLQHTGRHGTTAWTIACGIAFFGLVLGFAEGSFAIAVFRPIIPLMLTKVWWDGILGDAKRKVGTFKWTPRNLLIRLGAIEADERDVTEVNRDRLIQRMTDLYYDSLHGPEGKRETRRSKLARLTLDADDAIVAEVMHRVRRTAWTTATPLPYQLPQEPADADVTQEPAGPVTQHGTRTDARVAVPPARRVKATKKAASTTVTSGDAPDADPATQAAKLYMTTQDLSYRKAADAVGGTSEASVRRRVAELRATQPDAPSEGASTEIPMTPIPDPKPAVTHANGSTFNPGAN